jgi:carbon-monoxide dehydrogenase large subunit
MGSTTPPRCCHSGSGFYHGTMAGSILGTRVVRVEDPDLLQGKGTYVANLPVEGCAQVAFVRSPHAYASINAIDTREAAHADGVLAVLTGEDLAIADVHAGLGLDPELGQPALATHHACYVGEPIVAVVATTRAQAEAAAELVAIAYTPGPPVIDPLRALAEGAPTPFGRERNIAAGYRDEHASEALADAEIVVRARLVNQRMAPAPMEGNAILAIPHPEERFDLVVYLSTQMPHLVADQIAGLFGLDRARIRLVAPHVGGAFGGKVCFLPEYAVVITAAQRLGRPVRWVEDRSENMLAMPHGRAQVQYVELGLARDGRIRGLRCRMVGDGGAYGAFGGGLALGPTRMMAQGVYQIPRIGYEAAAVLTNTTPVGAFRGAGRPEAASFLERMLDLAASELGLDPVELRRRNLVPPEAFPYTTAVGTTYDSGDYAAALERVCALGGYDELRAEQSRRREQGDVVQLGIGISCYVEVTAGGAGEEYARVEVLPDGSAEIQVGTSAHGQGHATAFSMIVAERLGIPMERIRFTQSDTAVIPRGQGTGGSRSLQIGGSAVAGAAERVLARARELLARELEADPRDLVVAEGGLEVAGVPASRVGWARIAELAASDGSQLAEIFDFDQQHATFPFGAHLSVVEVDTETGRVRVLRHVAVDDCGRMLNPLLVEGQQQGGVAQGIAQALYEQVCYDELGNPLTATLADYLVPSAAELPPIEAHHTETPTPLNPLGAKGIGESGTIGSTPAVQNAVIDALAHLGVRHIDMPLTPERVWRAISQARSGVLPDPWEDPPAIFASLPPRGTRGTAGPDFDV